jgi:hypothetical protein
MLVKIRCFEKLLICSIIITKLLKIKLLQYFLDLQYLLKGEYYERRT